MVWEEQKLLVDSIKHHLCEAQVEVRLKEYDLLARLLAVMDGCVAHCASRLRRKAVDLSRSCCVPTSTVISFIHPVQMTVPSYRAWLFSVVLILPTLSLPHCTPIIKLQYNR